MQLSCKLAALVAFVIPCSVLGYLNQSSIDMRQTQLSLMGDRPENCPPCFNCLLPAFSCGQFSECNQYNGKCSCPPGFGGDDCLSPVCGSLAKGNQRKMRLGDYCECDDGWTGINCNVCTKNKACNDLMPTREGGVCYQNGEVVHENFQMCSVTNQKIIEVLKGRRPQVTFTCNRDHKTCDFQFWVEHEESFYCALDNCISSAENSYQQNSTSYECENVKCNCIPGRMLCGENGSVDITDFLNQLIKGPATFRCQQENGVTSNCRFKEPEMDKLIQNIFGDDSIHINCQPGECLYHTDVPGYQRPIKKINTPLIAGVIAAGSLFVVFVFLIIWYISRRRMSYGAIRLDDSDDETSKLMTVHKPASLYFENVSYNLNGKQILTEIKGIAHAGQVLAIMGASGAGKTTFLDILARRNKKGIIEGNFYVNGEKVHASEYRNVIGFVDQEDSMHSTLTVHETIMNSALLRLPRDMGLAAKEQRVYEVEKQLGIYSIRDSLIGSKEEGKGHGISGGEKRRVGIACELVTSPSILFLDEPTSGLDAFNAFNVIECLVTLAKTYNRTVIFTIHQPRSNIVALFDRLLLLSKGRAVYSGDFSQCQEYFDQIGYSCPSGFNIADYLVDLTMHVGGKKLPPNDGIVALPDETASNTRSSSTTAIKSIESISGVSVDDSIVGGLGDSFTVLQRKRNDSIKARQERELYTRKRISIDGTGLQNQVPQDTKLVRISRQKLNAANYSTAEDNGQVLSELSHENSFDVLVTAFEQSEICKRVQNEIESAISDAQAANSMSNDQSSENGPMNVSIMGTGYARIGYLQQFLILSRRTWKNIYRNPMLMLTHYAIAIILAVLSGFLFYGLTDDIPGFQNRLGLFFFILALFGFSTLSSLTVFSAERTIFVRERANGYYSPITYFAAKVLLDIIPLRIVPPIIMGSIVYPMTGLVPDVNNFFRFLFVLVLFNLAAAGICLFIGILCGDNGVASLIGSLIMLFSLLFAGLLLNHDAIPKSALWLQSLSIFHYAFEALIVNEVTYLTLTDEKYGLNITVPGAVILSSFGFNTQAFWADTIELGIFAVSFIILAYSAMHILLTEKR
ncbi:ABC transporter G family member [Golovinomyces cichoracearum]|uniref:ABC transporter G family member n=1 Tax=Golovinomyces cichoracearum TaxID=62708 RepID=A0A420H9N2_9PEZI|nr:ABC transporter G family member [Golovinomyces cichoracearum]